MSIRSSPRLLLRIDRLFHELGTGWRAPPKRMTMVTDERPAVLRIGMTPSNVIPAGFGLQLDSRTLSVKV
jgi:hypothetical protein